MIKWIMLRFLGVLVKNFVGTSRVLEWRKQSEKKKENNEGEKLGFVVDFQWVR